MTAQQVSFIEVGTDNPIFGGILIDDRYIICGECGGVFDLADGDAEIIERFPAWVDLSDEIIGR